MIHKKRYSYCITLQFLGFRYSGWQKQPGQKTIEGMLLKTFRYVLPNIKVKILGAGRTDAKVSALSGAFQLFVEEQLEDLETFLSILNKNLPPDIRVLTIKPVDEHFNIIHDKKQKEYIYLFSNEVKNHPFAAPFMVNVAENIDIELMKKGAQLFEGTHDFHCYTARMRPNSTFVRTIEKCEISKNTILKANFFPEQSYILTVKGDGFMRYQIRMLMGTLILLGKKELTLDQIKTSLSGELDLQLNYVAPGSGLILNALDFKS